MTQLHYDITNMYLDDSELSINDITNNICPICLDTESDDDNKIEPYNDLPCQHVFHNKCIEPWISKNGLCPICRANVNNRPVVGEARIQLPAPLPDDMDENYYNYLAIRPIVDIKCNNVLLFIICASLIIIIIGGLIY